MDDLPPPGYVEGPASLPPPPGYVEGPAATPPQGLGGIAANAATGLLKGVSSIPALPNTLATAYQALARGLGQPSPAADAIAGNTPSAEDTSRIMFGDINQASTAMTGAPTSLPYTPESGWGRIGQAALSNVAPAMLGGAAGAGTRLMSGMAGGAGSQAYANAQPNDYWGQLAASLTSALLGGGVAQGVRGARALMPTAAAERTVGGELAAAAPVPAAPGANTNVVGFPGGGPMVAGGAATSGTPSGGLAGAFGQLAGPVLGFGLEHFLEGMGGTGGAVLGKYAGDFFHDLASKKATAALESVRQNAQSNPVYKAQLMQQFNSSPGWQAYLRQSTPWAALPPPGGPLQQQ